MQRRKFIKSSLVAGVSAISLPAAGSILLPVARTPKPLDFRLSLDVPCKLFDGKTCWTHPRAGIIPTGKKEMPQVEMLMYKLDLSGNDIFTGVYRLSTPSPDKSFSGPERNTPLDLRIQALGEEECRVGAASLWPAWHRASKKLLATGSVMEYTMNWKVPKAKLHGMIYAVFDERANEWQPWKRTEITGVPDLETANPEGTQRYDEADGTILLPVGYKPKSGNSGVTVLHCKFDGEILSYMAHGNFLRVEDSTRGLSEPSLTKFGNIYFLTVRHNETAFVTTSKDGLNFEPLQKWKFDDGSELGSYNTQQHWVTHSHGLFLVYTRRGANNNNVYRNRAPLFMAQVDSNKLCVIRATEVELMPNKGARYGNFGVTNINQHETWVTESEWMQPKGCEKYGSDGKVLIARIHWAKPNQLMV